MNEVASNVVAPPKGVAVAVGVSVSSPTAVAVAVVVAVPFGVSVAVAVTVSVITRVPGGVAVKVADVSVGSGVPDKDGIFQPFGTCGWITMPTATCFPFERLLGAIMVTNEPTASRFARAGGNIFSDEESMNWCWLPC